MKSWQTLEIDATNFLTKNYSDYITAILQGGSDSNISDVLVKTYTNKTFYIDVKKKNAQCGQFVLHPDKKNKEFVFSKRNKSILTESTSKIISFMNRNFQSFFDAGTSGITIHIPDDTTIFSNWIIDYYTQKNVEFIITKDHDFLIIPLKEIAHYFDITAKYRVKQSGSHGVPEKHMDSIKKHIIGNYNVLSFRNEKDKLFVSSPNDLHKHKFNYENKTYMFSNRNDEFEIRTLSNTINANVIFSIDLKQKISIDEININKKFIDFISI